MNTVCIYGSPPTSVGCVEVMVKGREEEGVYIWNEGGGGGGDRTVLPVGHSTMTAWR
jgi:hypothetical protein